MIIFLKSIFIYSSFFYYSINLWSSTLILLKINTTYLFSVTLFIYYTNMYYYDYYLCYIVFIILIVSNLLNSNEITPQISILKKMNSLSLY